MANKFLNEIVELEKKENRKINVLNKLRRWQTDDYESTGMITEDKIRRIVCSSKEEAFPNEKIIREYMLIEEKDKQYLIREFNRGYKWRRPNLKMSQVRGDLLKF